MNGSPEKRITAVLRKSPAEKAGVKAGLTLLRVNGHEIADIFDYRYFAADAEVLLELSDDGGEILSFSVKKGEYEDLGLEFANPMLAKDRSCANRCVFCFIDQMPEGMRDTLYFKDDDLRLSFLTGNYVTLTNCPMEELRRLAGYRISPINVSIHTTNPELRVKMLGHQGAGNILEKIRLLLDHGITVNGQIVLVPGWNDGEELRRTLDDLMALPEPFHSVCIVPVGLTRFRDELTPLRPFTEEEAGNTVDLVRDYQTMCRIQRGSGFIYLSDEFYLKAGRPLPTEAEYDGFPQLEDGVGMLTLLSREVDRVLSDEAFCRKAKRKIRKYRKTGISGTVATGELAYLTLSGQVRKVKEFAERAGVPFHVETLCVKNDFFGHNVTVAGLLTGQDVVRQVKGKTTGERLFLTVNMFRSGENVFLDDMTSRDAERELGVRIVKCGKSGEEFVRALLFG